MVIFPIFIILVKGRGDRYVPENSSFNCNIVIVIAFILVSFFGWKLILGDSVSAIIFVGIMLFRGFLLGKGALVPNPFSRIKPEENSEGERRRR